MYLFITDYTETKLINIANSELADTLGNLVSRVSGAALNPRAEFPALSAHELTSLVTQNVVSELLDKMDRLPGELNIFVDLRFNIVLW